MVVDSSRYRAYYVELKSLQFYTVLHVESQFFYTTKIDRNGDCNCTFELVTTSCDTGMTCEILSPEGGGVYDNINFVGIRVLQEERRTGLRHNEIKCERTRG